MSTSNDFFQRLYRRPKSLLFAAGVVIVSLVLYASPNHALDYNAILDRAAYFGSKPESAESTKRRAISDRISELEAQFGKRFFQASAAAYVYSGQVADHVCRSQSPTPGRTRDCMSCLDGCCRGDRSRLDISEGQVRLAVLPSRLADSHAPSVSWSECRW